MKNFTPWTITTLCTLFLTVVCIASDHLYVASALAVVLAGIAVACLFVIDTDADTVKYLRNSLDIRDNTIARLERMHAEALEANEKTSEQLTAALGDVSRKDRRIGEIHASVSDFYAALEDIERAGTARGRGLTKDVRIARMLRFAQRGLGRAMVGEG
jgi:uncharacterized protein YoxC